MKKLYLLFLLFSSSFVNATPSGYYFWASPDESFVGMAINSNGQGHVLAYNDTDSGSMLYDSFNLSESGDFSVSTWDEYSGTTTLVGNVNGNLFSGTFAGMSFKGYRREDSGRASEFAGFYSGTYVKYQTLKNAFVFISPDGQGGGVSSFQGFDVYDGEIGAVYEDGTLAHLDMIDGEKMSGSISISGNTLTGNMTYSLLDGSEEEQWSLNATRDFRLETNGANAVPMIRVMIESDEVETFDTVSLFEELSALLDDEISGISFTIVDDGKTSGTATFSANTFALGYAVSISGNVSVSNQSFDLNGNGIGDYLEHQGVTNIEFTGTETLSIEQVGRISVIINGTFSKPKDDRFIKVDVSGKVTESTSPFLPPTGLTLDYVMPDIPPPSLIGNLVFDSSSKTANMETIGFSSISNTSGNLNYEFTDSDTLKLIGLPLPGGKTQDFTLSKSGDHYVGIATTSNTVYQVEVSNLTDVDENGIPDSAESPAHTVQLSSSEGGSVTGAGNYQDGETATIEAIPSFGYRFVGWSGGLSGSSKGVSLTVTQDVDAAATFEKAYANKGWLWFENYPWVYSNIEKDWVYFLPSPAGKLFIYSNKYERWEEMSK